MQDLYELLNSYHVPDTVNTTNFCSYEDHLAYKAFYLLLVIFQREIII